MLTVISSTNRKDSNTFIIAQHVYDLCKELYNDEVKFLDLRKLNDEFNYHPEMYTADNQNDTITKIQDEYIIPASRFVFIIPEYNGSFPGILKTFVDACSVRSYAPSFYHKRSMLIGVASGRAGNLRGMDHFNDILQYLEVIVYPQKLPVSSVTELIEGNKVIDVSTDNVLRNHIKKFLTI